MTAKEAIETLRANYPDACYEQLREAVDAAIEALKARDTARDTISRQAAIDALAKFVPYAICDASTESYTNGLTDAYNLICQLPSAQPEPCEDAVSRRRLLSDLKELTAAWGKYPVMAEQIKGVETAIGYVETIPSVTPERKSGKWIIRHPEQKNIFGGKTIECSECGTRLLVQYVEDEKYCRSCGVKMEEGEQE